MSKIYNLYENDMDRAWYDSSNVIYSECDDVTDGLKVLRVTFKNGSTYQYKDVNVNDYLLFRENESQGKALNKFIKQYAFEKLDDKDVDELKEKLEELMSVVNNDEGFYVEINKDNFLVYYEGNLMNTFSLNDTPKEILSNLLKSIEVNFKIVE